MIEIYLDPNKDAFLGEEGGGEVQANHISDARRLLSEIPKRRPEDIEKAQVNNLVNWRTPLAPGTLWRSGSCTLWHVFIELCLYLQILECYCQMATGNKSDITTAQQKFQDMVGQSMEHVPAMLGVSVAYVMQKQTPKARNMLKRIVKLEYR